MGGRLPRCTHKLIWGLAREPHVALSPQVPACLPACLPVVCPCMSAPAPAPAQQLLLVNKRRLEAVLARLVPGLKWEEAGGGSGGGAEEEDGAVMSPKAAAARRQQQQVRCHRRSVGALAAAIRRPCT